MTFIKINVYIYKHKYIGIYKYDFIKIYKQANLQRKTMMKV